jgi:hypothetical protein
MLWKSNGALRTRDFAECRCSYETALNINETLFALEHPHSIVGASPGGAAGRASLVGGADPMSVTHARDLIGSWNGPSTSAPRRAGGHPSGHRPCFFRANNRHRSRLRLFETRAHGPEARGAGGQAASALLGNASEQTFVMTHKHVSQIELEASGMRAQAIPSARLQRARP